MLPARFTLLMAFNPCPCGWLTSTSRRCRCDDGQARRYAGRLSGPMRDRLDLWVRADEPRHADPDGVEPSATVAQRIRLAWQRQLERQGMANGELPPTGGDAGLALDSASANPSAAARRQVPALATAAASRRPRGAHHRRPRRHRRRSGGARRRGAALPAGGGRVIGVGRARSAGGRPGRRRGSASADGQLAGTRPRVDRRGGGPARTGSPSRWSRASAASASPACWSASGRRAPRGPPAMSCWTACRGGRRMRGRGWRASAGAAPPAWHARWRPRSGPAAESTLTAVDPELPGRAARHGSAAAGPLLRRRPGGLRRAGGGDRRHATGDGLRPLGRRRRSPTSWPGRA